MHLHSRSTQGSQSQQQERDTEEEITHVAVFLQVDEDYTYQESGIDGAGDVEGHTCRHDPRRQRRSYISTHDDGDGLGERQQTGVHEGHSHHRGSR